MKNGLVRNGFESDWGFGAFDRLIDSFFVPSVKPSGCGRMLTDVRETDKAYELKIDMPGYEKQEINLSLEDGYLIVNASRKSSDNEEYIKRERSYSCSRSFYVGKLVTEQDVKAKYNNGTLCVEVAKKQPKELEKKNIAID